MQGNPGDPGNPGNPGDPGNPGQGGMAAMRAALLRLRQEMHAHSDADLAATVSEMRPDDPHAIVAMALLLARSADGNLNAANLLGRALVRAGRADPGTTSTWQLIRERDGAVILLTLDHPILH